MRSGCIFDRIFGLERTARFMSNIDGLGFCITGRSKHENKSLVSQKYFSNSMAELDPLKFIIASLDVSKSS